MVCFLLPGQKFRCHGNIMDVCGGDFERVRQTAVPVRTDMSFIAKVPRVTSLDLMSFRVAPMLPVLCGGRSGDDGRIHNRSLLQQRPFCLKQLYYLSKQLLLQPIAYQKIPKPPQRIAVRHLAAGVHAADGG